MRSRQARRCSSVFFILLLVPLAGAFAATAATCYNCDNFSGTWECSSGGFSGGDSCETDGDKCTVKGDCGSSSGAQFPVSVGSGLIMEIATVHPRVAATLFELTATSQTTSPTTVFWHNDEITAEDVQTLIQGGTIGLEPYEPAVVYESNVEPSAGTPNATLSIVPVVPSGLDPYFSEFHLFLVQEDPEGPYLPVMWEILE